MAVAFSTAWLPLDLPVPRNAAGSPPLLRRCPRCKLALRTFVAAAVARCAPQRQRTRRQAEIRPGGRALDRGSACDQEGRGILKSVCDLPRLQALGIELRASAALAAPITATDGSFVQEPYRVRHTLGEDAAENQKQIGNTLRELIKHFKWKGVVGCSVTKQVSKLLGIEDLSFNAMEAEATKIVSKCLYGKASFVHAMVHTVAAGYSDLVWGESAQEELWRGKVVLVCTLGKNLGAVVFNDGHRVRHESWCRATPEVSECPPQIFASDSALPSRPFAPPQPGSTQWDQWAAAIDDQLSEMILAVGDVDHVLIMPTGRTAGQYGVLSEELRPKLVRVLEAVEGKGCALSLLDQREGTVVRGAAICALVELETVQMMDQLRQVLERSSSLQSLSEAQMRDIFERLDTGGDNLLQPEELRNALELLGIQRDLKLLLSELEIEEGEAITLDKFMSWWLRNVKSARLVTLTSAAAWKDLLQLPPPEGFGTLILLEVTFTFCRSCRSFEPKFRKLAEAYPEVRFVQLVGNATIGAMQLVQEELKCKKSPAFFIFRRGGEMLDAWTGANSEKLEQHLRSWLTQEAS